MKITILTQYFPPETGAPQRRLFLFAQELKRRGHEVYILTGMPNYPKGQVFEGYSGFFSEEDMDGLRVLRAFIYPSRSLNQIKRMACYFSFVFSSFFIGLFKLPKSDLLIFESPPLFLGISAYFLAKLKGAKLVMNVSDLWPQGAIDMGMVSEGFSLRKVQKLEAWLYKKSHLIFGQSKGIVQSIQNRFPESDVRPFLNGADLNEFRPAAFKIQKKNPLVTGVYAGLLGRAQGLEQVIDACGKLDQENLKIELYGDGPEREELIARHVKVDLRGFVSIMGSRPPSEIPKILQRSDFAIVCLAGNIVGAVPSKLYEAMACGLPILLVAHGEAANVVNEAECGFAIAPGNIQGILEAMQILESDASLREKMGSNGRKAVCRKFDRERINARICKILEKELNENTARSWRTA